MAGEDRTGNLEKWEDLFIAITCRFIEKVSTVMIDENQFATAAATGAYATKINPKKGRSGPLGDAACTSD